MRIVVLSADAFASYELPAEGEVVIGRSETSDLRIDDPSITRRHAVLRVGERLEVEDLGSVNGTRVREQRLRRGQPVPVAAGEPFYLGAALVMIQPEREAEPPPLRPDDVVTRRAELEAPPSRPPRRIDDPAAPLEAVVLHDPVMREIYAYVDRLAPGNIAVLVVGETGVGKELVAERLHRSSPRRSKPFVRLNCAAFAESLLESELFGYERAAFTGASQPKPGLLESAEGGTVLLDEIGEMPMPVQAKILRVIEAKQVTRVGGLTPRTIDVRFVAATNRDLPEQIRAGRFREDLYFRLNAARVVVPPLRDRTSELGPMATAFVARACRDLGRPATPRLSEAALRLFERYAWPGNVRELRNFVERAVLVADGDELLPEHFPLGQMAETLAVQPLTSQSWPRPPAGADPAERERILAVLSECGGNQSRAAKRLGIARSTLVARLQAYGVPRPRRS
jgi:two-component system response regulator AtoC